MGEFNNENHTSNDKLPPRSVYHTQNKGNEKNNYRIKLPFIRLISLIVIILVISLVSIKLFADDSKPAATEPNIEDTPPISEIGKAEDEEEEEKEQEEEAPTIVEEEEEATIPDENTTVVKPSVTEKPATSTNESSSSNSKPDTSTEQPSSTVEKPSTTTPTAPETSDEPKVEYIEHIVGEEETLYRIAMKYFKSPSGVEIIQKHNGLTGTNIRAGQVLKIPKQ